MLRRLTNSSANESRVAASISILPDSVARPRIVACVQVGSIVVFLGDARSTSYVVDHGVLVLVATAFGAQAAADAAENIKLIEEETELLASKKLLARL